MPRNGISYETANKIAAVWPSASSLRDAMERAGIKTQDIRRMNRYRRQTEDMLGIQLPTINQKNRSSNLPHTTEQLDFDHPVTVLIFGDGHFWPNQTAPAFWVLLEVLNKLKPDIVIDNGDSFDATTVSRHAPISFEDLPSLKDEYEACIQHLNWVKEASTRSEFYRNVGNHDLRLEARLAQQLPEMVGMPFTTTSEMFPGWKHNYSVSFNGHFMVKHRLYSGVHAAYNNVLKSGISIATGHTHKLGIRRWTDFSGTRYGIETGTVADIYGPQFSYTEDGLRDWQAGFVVIEVDGKAIYPELVEVKGNEARFRGKVYTG